MITGHINEPANLAILPKVLQWAVEYLQKTDLVNHPAGRFALEGDDIILQVLDLETAPRPTLRPESHQKYVDVQFLAAGGPEHIAWYPNLGGNVVEEDLLATPRDICFYKNNPAQPEGLIAMQVGSYAMFFPWDIHVPAIAVQKSCAIRKIVLKIKLARCVYSNLI